MNFMKKKKKKKRGGGEENPGTSQDKPPLTGMELYDCIWEGDLDQLQYYTDNYDVRLGDRFPKVRDEDHAGMRPVHMAAYKGHLSVLQYLWDNNCDMAATTLALNRTPLMYACGENNIDCVLLIIRQGTGCINNRDEFGNACLHYASDEGYEELVDILLTHGAEVNIQDMTLKTPLMKVMRRKHMGVVKQLLETGASLNIVDNSLDTALHHAVRPGGGPFVSLLVDSGADTDYQNKRGHSPLIEAIACRSKKLVPLLVQAGCDVNIQDYLHGNTALHMAVSKNYSDIVTHILKSGRMNHVYNKAGELAVYPAVSQENIGIIKLFLQYNYDFSVYIKITDETSPNRQSAVRVALEMGCFSVLRLLSAAGCLAECSDFRFSEWSHNVPPAASPLYVSELERFLSEVEQLISLKMLARTKIRLCIGSGIQEKVRSLGIPKALELFILLQDVLHEHY